MKLETIFLSISLMADIVTIISLFIVRNQIIKKIENNIVINENKNIGDKNTINNNIINKGKVKFLPPNLINI